MLRSRVTSGIPSATLVAAMISSAGSDLKSILRAEPGDYGRDGNHADPVDASQVGRAFEVHLEAAQLDELRDFPEDDVRDREGLVGNEGLFLRGEGAREQGDEDVRVKVEHAT